TGRTHQIRVHLSHERLPILGDPVYARNYHPGQDIPEPSRSVISGLDRQALHAELLAFVHPITHQDIHISAPLPDDLRKLAAALQQNYA
ncbi:MAG: RluA family pseudouridine synthase, partial [Mariprofundaceae bacterium]